MKLLKKLSSLLLAVLMVFAMGTTAFADDTDTAPAKETITVKDGDDHTYEVYQIFTGKLETVDGKNILTEVKYGQNGKGTGEVAEEVLKELQAVADETDDNAKLAVIKKYANLETEKLGTVSAKNTLSVDPGYYLFKDVDANITGADTFSLYVVKIVEPTEIVRKADVPEMIKKLKEKNDTTGEETDWQDASDYDIGDHVPYQIKTTIVKNYADYEHYYLAFNDKMEKGLTFDNNVEVYVNGNKIEGFTTDTGVEGYTFVTSCLDITTLTYGNNQKIKAGDEITVEYTARLNEEAELGATGNRNTANMEFSNNPNNTGDGTKKPDQPGKTPDDTVITFTYKTVINKIEKVKGEDGQETSKPLAGATFKLEKKLADGSYEEKALVANDAGTIFTFTGLDAGEYKITEVNPPKGYNKIKDITFTVKSKWGPENDKNPNLELTGLSVETVDNTEFTVEMKEGTAAPTGVISTDVENKKGSSLPETGGIGTTLFYTFGALMVVGASVLLITKRRMQEN